MHKMNALWDVRVCLYPSRASTPKLLNWFRLN